MKFAIAGLFVFGAAALAQSVEYDLYTRDALMDMDDMFDDTEFWTRDAELDFDDWMDGGLSARDLGGDEDGGAITRIFWTREAKKSSSNQPAWTPPKVNIPKGDKVLKNTFKCNTKKETCSGEIDLQAPA